jgi:phosphatidylserine decarboxylase
MKIHREGYKIITFAGILMTVVSILSVFLLQDNIRILIPIIIASIAVLLFLMNFFRVPSRTTPSGEGLVYAPADGHIVAVEEVFEDEFLKEKRIQISIFMSVWDVHINYFPVKGVVNLFRYHPGKFLVARHPKSSTLNERTTILIENENNIKILIRQIAGIVARRIICYAQQGDRFNPGDEMGFIKFGSRVDLFLPYNSKILVRLNDRVSGGLTPVATL